MTGRTVTSRRQRVRDRSRKAGPVTAVAATGTAGTDATMQPIESVRNSAPDDPHSVGAFAREAEDFLRRQRWCQGIARGYLDRAWDGILGVFFFEIVPAQPGVDRTMWVITGDVPPAYICNANATGAEALRAYLAEMQLWVDAVQRGTSVERLIPVNAPPTAEYADMLASRLDFIRRRLLPEYR